MPRILRRPVDEKHAFSHGFTIQAFDKSSFNHIPSTSSQFDPSTEKGTVAARETVAFTPFAHCARHENTVVVLPFSQLSKIAVEFSRPVAPDPFKPLLPEIPIRRQGRNWT
jgi:hypothetical protein